MRAPLLVGLWVYGVAAALLVLMSSGPPLPRLIVTGIAHGVGIPGRH